MPALQITWKDLRLLARDRRAAAVLLALPLIFIAIIGLTTGQILNLREGGEDVRIAVVNQATAGNHEPSLDSGAGESEEPEAGERLVPEGPDAVNRILEALRKHDHFEITEVDSLERAREDLDRGHVQLILVIGPEFHARVSELELSDILGRSGGRLAAGPSSLDLTFATKPSLAKIGELAAGVAYADVLRTIAPLVARNSKNVFINRQLQLAEQRARQAPPAELHLIELVEQSKRTTSVLYESLVPSYTVLFVFFLVNIMARSFIAERELGTLRRLRLAPIGPVGLLVGKNIPFYCLSLVQTVLLFLCGRLLFGMSWGTEPWLLAPVIACTSLAATALGLMVSTIIRTDSQVSAYGNSLVIILAGISGCFLPRQWLPDVMQKVSLATPHAWALLAYDEILGRQHVLHSEVAKSCGMLLAFAAVFFTVGWIRFRLYQE